MTSRNHEITASFPLTPELWIQASRVIRRRQRLRQSHPRPLRWPPLKSALWWIPLTLITLAWADHAHGSDDGLLPLMILLNVVVLLGCLLALLAPALIRWRFRQIYQRLPEPNRQVIWRFSPTRVSAEGGLTRFDGTWDDIREIVATPGLFLIFRRQKSAAGAVPVTAFAHAQALEDFVFLARSRVTNYVNLPDDAPPPPPAAEP